MGDRRTSTAPSRFMLLANGIPLTQVILGGLLLFTMETSLWVKLIFLILWIYLMPPLLCRALLMALGRPGSTSNRESKDFKIWFVLTQLQMIYMRFPALEACLKLLPGLYNSWLNLWGSRVHPLTYWCPGVTLSDRYLLKTGASVVLGTECFLGTHLLTTDDQGRLTLTVGPIQIDENAIIGARVMIAPGCHIHKNEQMGAGERIMPFNQFKHGKRIKSAITGGTGKVHE